MGIEMERLRNMGQIKTKIQNDWLLYLAAILTTMLMRCFIRASDTDMLKWILAPTARWAGILAGITFEYLPHQGYVNHGSEFLIAASCSGSRFMLLTFLMLVFIPADPQREDIGSKCRRLGVSIVLAYLFTVFVNGIRIVLSIRLPVFLEGLHVLGGWLTPDRLHTLIGTVTYFASLCVIYQCAAAKTGNSRLAVPVFWYLLIVLALPFVKRVWQNDWTGFEEYAVLIIGVCLVVRVVFGVLGKKLHNLIGI